MFIISSIFACVGVYAGTCPCGSRKTVWGRLFPSVWDPRLNSDDQTWDQVSVSNEPFLQLFHLEFLLLISDVEKKDG